MREEEEEREEDTKEEEEQIFGGQQKNMNVRGSREGTRSENGMDEVVALG